MGTRLERARAMVAREAAEWPLDGPFGATVRQYGAAHQAPYYRNAPKALRYLGREVPAPEPPHPALVAWWALVEGEEYSPSTKAAALALRAKYGY